MSRDIKQLEELIKPHLIDGKRLISYQYKNLLASGENYGSVMLQVTIKVSNKNDEEEIIHCVGKLCPPSEMLLELFNTKVTFKKEIAIYKVIVPTLNSYIKEKGINRQLDFFAKCLGARISLDPKSDVVDENAVILLENLKVLGYDVSDRCTGFDEECSKLLLKDLAEMHATTIAYKSAKPEEFKTKILPFLNKDYVFDADDKFMSKFSKSIQNATAKNPECVPYLSKIEKALLDMKHFNKNPTRGKEIFATFTHNDYWINNVMLKYENGKPIKSKMVDFQVIEYASLAHDVIFFIYSSVQISVLENQSEELFKYYYEVFIDTLRKLQCNTNQYSYEAMMGEFALIARNEEFSHLLYMLVPINTLKGESKELSEFKLDDLIIKEDKMHENYFRRTQFVLLNFVKRGWV